MSTDAAVPTPPRPWKQSFLAGVALTITVGGVLIAPLLLRPPETVAAAPDPGRVAFEAKVASCLKLDEQISKASTASGVDYLWSQSTALDCKAVRKGAQR